jgi:ubiquinone/menaquinone biosynthesis C-methylase UbiE
MSWLRRRAAILENSDDDVEVPRQGPDETASAVRRWAREIVNPEADLRFRALAIERRLDPGNRWIGGSVDHAWDRNRPVFERFDVPVTGAKVLEFGCYMGGTAILLEAMGAKVTAVDADPTHIELSRLNAERYGATNIDFHHVADATRLPFRDGEFDVAVCYSVLEYLPDAILDDAMREIARTVRGGGVIFVAGTSNRLWPREIHSRRWLTNYVPKAVDRMLSRSTPLPRGLWPWEIRQGFGRSVNLDLTDRGRAFLESRRARGMGAARYTALRLGIFMGRIVGVWGGLLIPCISIRLKKL